MYVLKTNYPPSSRPILLWDAECDFCRIWIHRWKQMTGKNIDYEPYQEAVPKFPDIKVEYFKKSVCLVVTDGTVYTGAEAVFRTLSGMKTGRFLHRAYTRYSTFRTLSEKIYSFISNHRPFFYTITKPFLK